MSRTLMPFVLGACAVGASVVVSNAVLSTPATAQARAGESIAVVNAQLILRDMRDQQGHNDALGAREVQMRADLVTPYEQQMMEIQEQYAARQQAGEDVQLLVLQYQQIQQVLNANMQEIQSTLIEQNDNATLSVFNHFRSVVADVADDLGYTYVIASDDPTADFIDAPGTYPGQVQSRIVLVSPDRVDITAEVRDRLGLIDADVYQAQREAERQAETEAQSNEEAATPEDG